MARLRQWIIFSALCIVFCCVQENVFAGDPTYCLRYGTEHYRCNGHQCNCQVCHTCGCETLAPWHGCHHDSCSECWCSSVCKCCYTTDCRRYCHCSTCYDDCTRTICADEITYHVSGLEPEAGLRNESTTVVVTGSRFANTHSIRCKFGQDIVPATYISSTKVQCQAPPQPPMSGKLLQSVNVEVSLDGGQDWTNNGHQFTFYQCEGEPFCSGHGLCNEDGTCSCRPGFFGPGCARECPGGAGNICHQHGVCSTDGVCTCSEGYFGVACENECPGGASNPCGGHGTCDDDGTCHCDAQHVGVACEYAGSCEPGGQCKCTQHGRFGPNCEGVCPNGVDHPCNDHGSCGGLHGKCFCAPGYWGSACEHVCPGGASSPCYFHALKNNTCSMNGTCECRDAYFGPDCKGVCPSATAGVPCSGHGTCNAEGSCRCDHGWVGTACDIECSGKIGNNLYCSGHGVCYPESKGVCTCDEGYWGNGCQNMCPGGVQSPCSGHGLCDSATGTCGCARGYYGPTCESVCPGGASSPCSDNGRCTETGSCVCRPGYFGSDCRGICPGGAQSPCNNNGTCTSNGQCVCNPQWTGTDCTVRKCEYDCYGHGTCVDGSCVCDDDWRGMYCSEPYESGNPSIHHGSIQFNVSAVNVTEDLDSFFIGITRQYGSKGNVSVAIRSRGSSALEGSDYFLSPKVFAWRDGELSSKQLRVDILLDNIAEDTEVFDIFFDRTTGGPLIGSNSAVSVRILQNNGTSNFVEITMRVMKPITELSPGSDELGDFEYKFRTDVSQLLNHGSGVARKRIQVAHVRADPEFPSSRVRVLLDIYPDANPGALKADTLAREFIELVRDQSSDLYATDRITRIIDTSFLPLVQGREVDVPPSDDAAPSSSTSPGVIAAAVVVPLIVIGLAIGCYIKRKEVVAWLLWKLGNFHFRQHAMNQDGSGDSDEDTVNSPEYTADNEAEALRAIGSDDSEEGVGNHSGHELLQTVDDSESLPKGAYL